MESLQYYDGENVIYSYPFGLYLTMGGILLAVSTTSGRLLLRKKKCGRLFADDHVHLWALVMLIICGASLSGLIVRFGEQLDNYSSEELSLIFYLATITYSFYWCAIFAARATFLTFYRHAFGSSRQFMIWWYAVSTLTTCAFFIAFLSMFWSCGSPSQYGPTVFVFQDTTQEFLACYPYMSDPVPTNSPPLVDAGIIATACNISSDLMVMILPTLILWRLKISRARKLKITGIFFLASATIVVDIFAWNVGYVTNLTYVYTEAFVAVFISALPAYGLWKRKKPRYSNLPPTRLGAMVANRHSTMVSNSPDDRWVESGATMDQRLVTDAVQAPEPARCGGKDVNYPDGSSCSDGNESTFKSVKKRPDEDSIELGILQLRQHAVELPAVRSGEWRLCGPNSSAAMTSDKWPGSRS